MSNQAPQNDWQAVETAQRYKIFTQKTTMYQELSQMMVELAEIQPGMHILDLGCGTGVTTQAVLDQLGNSGQVYALDISGPMLSVAREQVTSDRVTFLQADAAEADKLLETWAPLDRVVCNSVFWQFRHKTQVLAALHKLLAPTGRFIFNAPEPYFIFKNIPRSPKVSILFKQLAAERYGVGQQDLRTLAVFLRNHHLRLITTQPFERTRSAEESYLFFQLPVASAWMDPPLDYETRLALLEEAQRMANPDKSVRQRWMYFIVEPDIEE